MRGIKAYRRHFYFPKKTAYFLSSLNGMVPGGVSDQVPVSDQPIRKKDAQAMFAV